jgi:hypothetical protein
MQLVESFVEPRQVHHAVPEVLDHALPRDRQQRGGEYQFSPRVAFSAPVHLRIAHHNHLQTCDS